MHLPEVASRRRQWLPWSLYLRCTQQGGGLSKGLHESGVTKHKWAIDFWPPSAEAFKMNNPETVVLNEECNGLLSKAMKGEKGTRMPAKGEVDIMVGGPPCQGFSLLNIYKEREYSKFKNSLRIVSVISTDPGTSSWRT